MCTTLPMWAVGVPSSHSALLWTQSRFVEWRPQSRAGHVLCALAYRYVSDATVAIFVATLLFVMPSQRPQFNFCGQTEEGKAPSWPRTHRGVPRGREPALLERPGLTVRAGGVPSRQGDGRQPFHGDCSAQTLFSCALYTSEILSVLQQEQKNVPGFPQCRLCIFDFSLPDFARMHVYTRLQSTHTHTQSLHSGSPACGFSCLYTVHTSC